MTKKELLESEVFQMLPDDGEIMFATGEKLKECYALNVLNISLMKECVNENRLPHEYRCALLIDAIPYWLLKEKYGIDLQK